MVLKAILTCALLLSVIGLSWGLELQLSELSVSRSPITLEIEVNESRSIELVEGSSYTISCLSNLGGFQQSHVWFRNGFPVEVRVPGNETAAGVSAVYAIATSNNNEWNLRLRVFSQSLTGTYSCQRESERLGVVIGTGNPVVIAATPVLSLNRGVQSGGFPALFTLISGNPPPTSQNITWTFNGQLLSETRTSYTLDNYIEPDVAGEYVCSVTTSAGTASVSMIVQVNLLPSVMISNDPGPIEAGSSLTLVCSDSVGVPPPTFEWRKDSSPLTDDGSRVIITMFSGLANSTLTIDPVGREDAGVYACAGRNVVGTSLSATVDVEVLFPPVLSSPSLSPVVVVDDTLVLVAMVVAANPTPLTSHSWSKDGRSVRGESGYMGSKFNLTVPRVGLGDEGVYTLVVSNAVGQGTLNFSVTVNSPPTLTPVESVVYTSDRAPNVTLSLSISRARPPINLSQVFWSLTKRGMATPINLDEPRYTNDLIGVSQLSLTLSGPALTDSATYTVRIEHVAGNVTLDLELVVLRPPAPPTDIVAAVFLNSSCMVRIDWTTPTSPSDTASTSYTIVEARVAGGSEWVEVGRGVDMVVARIPFAGVDTQYQLRGRGVSDRVGEGDSGENTQMFTVYRSGSLPSVEGVAGTPVSPSSLRLSWALPAQDCLQFLSHTPSCVGGQQPIQVGMVRQPDYFFLFENLIADSLYNCSVSSLVTGLEREGPNVTVRSEYVKAFTYPNSPPTPEPPTANQSTVNTITVNFDLPDNHQDISHYQVIVLRLSSLVDMPIGHPDNLYLAGYTFDTHANVHRAEGSEYRPYIAAELSGALFTPVFVLGSGLQTNGSGVAYTNGRLAPNTLYTCFLRAFPKTFLDRAFRRRRAASVSVRQYDVFSSSGFLPAQRTSSLPTDSLLPVVVAVCVAVLGVLLILIVVVGVAIWYMRTQRQRRFKLHHKAELDHSTSTSRDGTPGFCPTPSLGRQTNGIELKEINMINPLSGGVMYEPSGPIKEDEFAAHVERLDANRQLIFQEEFEWIQTNSPWHPAEASNHPLNDDKNRYHNITAFDHTRVKLSPEIGVECSDYINANYILGYSGKNEYIATQGPLDQTVVEFWKMVWEQNTHTIVMLTNVVELGKVKCTQYWPINGTVIYGEVKVTLDRVVELPDYVIRRLVVGPLISNEKESRIVMQFQFTRWPDYGVPKLAAPLLNFLKAVNMSNPPSVGPIIIHCSAGVGRSGTVIAIDYCHKQLKRDGFMDPCGLIQQMRNQRNYMVQTDQQYTFLHFALLEAVIYGDTSYPIQEFNESYRQLKEVNPSTEELFLEEEFGRIGRVKTQTKRSSFQQKIKQKGAPQRHFNSSFMGSVSSHSGTLEPYSAHYIDTYSDSRRLIVVDGPTEDSITRWWQMVWDEDVAYVVTLTPQDEETFQYWPDSGCGQYGGIVVEVESESAEHLYTQRKIKLTNAKVTGISHSVEQFHFMGWFNQMLPRVPDFVGFVVDLMKAIETLKIHQRVLVHDIDSLGPCGVLCSLYFCIERLKTERVVDVFQAVQMMKLQRPGSVRSLQEYAFIYDCVYEFLRTHTDTEGQP